MTTDRDDTGRQLLAVGLLVVAAFARLLPHPPNMTPLVAVALFGGATLSTGLGIAVPLVAILASDLVLGLHDVVAFTWGSVLLTVMLGWWVGRRPRTGRIAGGAVLGSTLFFLVTNFGVWLLGHGGTMYPRTPAGVLECYVAALPFYRNALIGDLGWSLGLFGLYAMASRPAVQYAQVRSK